MKPKDGDILRVAHVKINQIYQTEIDDSSADKLCLWMQNILIPWSILRVKAKQEGRTLPEPLTLADFNRLNDICIKTGALAKLTDGDSKEGFVLNHEKCAEAVGLIGYKKQYEQFTKNKKGEFDVSFVMNLLTWGSLVELRDDGKHSLTAVGWYKADGKFYLEVRDPWPKTDDARLDCSRCMTQRYVGGRWLDSRSIESFAWFYKVGTSPKWIV